MRGRLPIVVGALFVMACATSPEERTDAPAPSTTLGPQVKGGNGGGAGSGGSGSCKANDKQCNEDLDCCSTFCAPTGVCANRLVTCSNPTNTCVSSADCCPVNGVSLPCVNGFCGCVIAPSCTTTSDCCGLSCVRDASGLSGTCQSEPAAPTAR